MGLSMQLKITGSQQVQNRLKRLGVDFKNLRPEMTEIGKQAAKYFSTVGFLSQGSVFGAKWAPLSRAYAARKAKRFPGRPLLVARGDMQDNYVYTATGNSVVITNKSEQFKYHQSKAPRKSKLPRRSTMGVNSPVKKMVREIVKAGVSKRAERR